jgi:hypothetical protein
MPDTENLCLSLCLFELACRYWIAGMRVRVRSDTRCFFYCILIQMCDLKKGLHGTGTHTVKLLFGTGTLCIQVIRNFVLPVIVFGYII